MAKIFRNQVAKYLRSEGFKVEASGTTLSFNNFHLVFDDDTDSVKVYNPHVSRCNVIVPYSEPERLVYKIRHLFSEAAQLNNSRQYFQ